jgi:hypothetical protein
MADFTLDTSGTVAMPAEPRHGAPRRQHYSWSDLSPFEQGYVEALFAGAVVPGIRITHQPTGDIRPATLNKLKLAFRDLAPETLAAIRKDCAAFYDGLPTMHRAVVVSRGQAAGRAFWEARQSSGALAFGGWPGPYAAPLNIAARRFPPLTPFLNDDGKVCLREAANG